jgi:hypothetical protein
MFDGQSQKKGPRIEGLPVRSAPPERLTSDREVVTAVLVAVRSYSTTSSDFSSIGLAMLK